MSAATTTDPVAQCLVTLVRWARP